MASFGSTPAEVLAIVRACAPEFRNLHDRLAFLIHSAMMAAGFRLVAAGQAAETTPLPDVHDEQDVRVDGWQDAADSYAFRYIAPSIAAASPSPSAASAAAAAAPSPERVILKALALGDVLLVDMAVLYGAGDADAAGGGKGADGGIHNLDLRVSDYADEGSDGRDFMKAFKNVDGFLDKVHSALIAPLHHQQTLSSTAAQKGERQRGVDVDVGGGRSRGGQAPDQHLRPPYFGAGGGMEGPLVYPPIPAAGFNDDLGPGLGAGVTPLRPFPGWAGGGGGGGQSVGVPGGGMLVGPHDQRWGAVGPIGGVPPGARYDPIGPPATEPGALPPLDPFGLERPMQRVRVPPGGLPMHPDLQQMGTFHDFI
eukprot:TRINITY_DN4293_c2_g1_i1.p1 TRINITY_DN4293_c2_g1~~TRINITY_DN4293_c2_g1_i1.p1  ORF type:complete len:382 (+),score=86.31 TRINITY_DN4293_c2_g1_i1:48-1148(+)